jgi:hypothetical protein
MSLDAYEMNQIEYMLKDLQERLASLRGYL